MNKQNKLFTIGAIALLIAVAVFGFASCDDGKDKDPPPNTDPILVGTVDGIPVYRVDGVSVAEAETAMAVLEEAYRWTGNLQKTKIKQEVDTVHFVSGSTITLVGKTMKVGINATDDDIYDYFLLIVD